MEEDPLEAVVKKMKLKKKDKKAEKKKKVTFDGDFAIKDADNDEEEDDDDLVDDSDEEDDDEEYDEEDGSDYEEDKDDIIEEVKGQKIKVDDANVEVKKIQKMKPAEGVKFTQYDEYGLPRDDGFDY